MAVVETRDRVWSPVLEGLAAPALDCVQTGLAALADFFHGPGAHLALGARLGLAVRTNPGHAPTLEVPVDQRLAEAEELAGLRVVERRDGLDGPALRQFAAEAGTLYVIADTFTMGWTPYRGQRHMDHSFLLVQSGDRVVDPYHNDTQWGAARPGVWRLSNADLDAAVSGGVSAMVITASERPELNPAAILAANAASFDIDSYLSVVRTDTVAAVEALVLDIWLLGRAWLLHAAWLDTPPEINAHAQEWLRLASQSYVALRRVQRGAPIPASVPERLEELLKAGAEFAARLADPVRAAVVQAVQDVLRVDEVSGAFRAMPNFNSFRLVDVIERVESRLGVSLDGEDLTLESLHDVDSLTSLFAGVAERVRS